LATWHQPLTWTTGIFQKLIPTITEFMGR
jgi:hypothetical protein